MTGLLLPVVAAVVGVVGVVGAALAWFALAPWVRVNLRTPSWRARVRTWLTVAVAVCFAVIAAIVGLSWSLPALLLFAAGGAVLAAVDLLERRIPNRMLVVVAAVVAAAILLGAVGMGSAWPLLWCAVGAAGLFLIYLVIALIAPSAMGMGDVKLAALVGGVLGFIGPVAILGGAVAIAFVGGAAALLLILFRRGAARAGVPYGPALVLGALIGALGVIATR
jgi:leader peptidase (prepilin peptidase)/N-methyltransferase